VLVAPLRCDVFQKSLAMRLVDLESEAVVGLFCGSQEEVSLGKQHCVDSHSLVFSSDGGTGLVRRNPCNVFFLKGKCIGFLLPACDKTNRQTRLVFLKIPT
jgi:hypothetical protein